MGQHPRCLYESNVDNFIDKEKEAIFGLLCEHYHGDALTTTREAWAKEIEILQKELLPWKGAEGHIVFEYDIPRFGKRIDMLNAYRVLLTRARVGMIICVPEGNAHKTLNGFWEDGTRKPEYYDGTYQYLKSLGLDEI